MNFIELNSLQGCILSIGSYPKFQYNARGGGGEGYASKNILGSLERIRFDPEKFSIPPLNTTTTRILGVPLPPGLEIIMILDKLEGTINFSTGEVIFDFESRFFFSIGSLIKFPALIVKTSLTSEKAKKSKRVIKGRRLKSDGNTSLVGISTIEPCGNRFLDYFLGLPTDAVAVLECEIKRKANY